VLFDGVYGSEITLMNILITPSIRESKVSQGFRVAGFEIDGADQPYTVIFNGNKSRWVVVRSGTIQTGVFEALGMICVAISQPRKQQLRVFGLGNLAQRRHAGLNIVGQVAFFGFCRYIWMLVLRDRACGYCALSYLGVA